MKLRVLRGPVVVGHVMGWPGDVIEALEAVAEALLRERPGMVARVDAETLGRGDAWTPGRGDMGMRRRRDTGTRR